jgi:hypothetical protein
VTVTYIGFHQIGGGSGTGAPSSASVTAWSGAQVGDQLILVFTGSYLSSDSGTVTVDSTWTLVGSSDVVARYAFSPFTRSRLTVWTKKATASDLGVASVTVSSGFIGPFRGWFAWGHIYRPGHGLVGDVGVDGVDQLDPIQTWQSPSAFAPVSARALTVYRNGNATGPGMVTGNSWSLDFAGAVSGNNQARHAVAGQNIVNATVVGPVWDISTYHHAVVFCIRTFPASGIYRDGAIHLS